MRRFILISVRALMATASVDAKKKWRSNGDDHEGYAGFRHEDVWEMEHYYYARLAGLPGGCRRGGADLPPGLKEELRCGGRLPPGLHKRMETCPWEVERRLPPLRRGLCRGLLGGHIVTYDERTMLVVDVTVITGRRWERHRCSSAAPLGQGFCERAKLLKCRTTSVRHACVVVRSGFNSGARQIRSRETPDL
jgi:hypothetical protein